MAQRKRPSTQAAISLTHPNAAGIDIGSASHFVAVAPDRDDEPVREFQSFTADLHRLADWLDACGVDTVAMESTGVYWIPLFELLESRGFTVLLVNARHVKNVSGRKSDVQDCQWLHKLMSLGFLRAAWRPDGEICVVRAVARQREVLLIEQASWVQRMQKSLVQMNIQLTEVLTDVMGMTGQAIIRAIVAGERDPKALAHHRDRRVKASADEITKALTGNRRDEHLFVLRQALAMYDDIARHLAECDTKGQAQREHRHSTPTRANGVFHAHPRRDLRRSRPATLRRTATSAQHRRPQTPSCSPRLRDQSDLRARMTTRQAIPVS